MEQIRAAIVGTGNIANSHAKALRSLGDRVRVVAGMDVDGERAEAFCREHGIPTPYTDLAELLKAERPRLVHVCTPPGPHCDVSVQCLEAGAWVLCEKPLCASLAELDRLKAAEEASGNYCSSVFQMRFGTGAAHLKQLMTEGALGRPLVGLCNTTWYRPHAYYDDKPWRGTWKAELGGPTMGHGIHAMDLFMWMMGDFAEVRAMIGTLDRRIEVEDVSMAAVRFENGAMGSVVNSVLSPRQETHLRLDFEKATVEAGYLYVYRNEDWRLSLPPKVEDDDLVRRWEAMRDEAEVEPRWAAQIAALLEDMSAGRRPLVSGHEARRTIEFITCLYKSAATGSPVARGSIGRDDPFYRHVGGTLAGGAA